MLLASAVSRSQGFSGLRIFSRGGFSCKTSHALMLAITINHLEGLVKSGSSIYIFIYNARYLPQLLIDPSTRD